VKSLHFHLELNTAGVLSVSTDDNQNTAVNTLLGCTMDVLYIDMSGSLVWCG
jgi:hypothetical protein